MLSELQIQDNPDADGHPFPFPLLEHPFFFSAKIQRGLAVKLTASQMSSLEVLLFSSPLLPPSAKSVPELCPQSGLSEVDRYFLQYHSQDDPVPFSL